MRTTGMLVNLFVTYFILFGTILRFTLFDLGDVGRHSDGGVLAHSKFGEALENNSLSFPEHHPLPNTTGPHLPYVIVGTSISWKKLKWYVWFKCLIKTN